MPPHHIVMNKVNINAPNNCEQWIDLGRVIIPCLKGKPEIKKWSDETLHISKEEWKNKYSHCAIALRLDENIDFDIDNSLVKRFIDKYVVSCGAVSGRSSNPSSHYLWKGKSNYAKFVLPKHFESIYKEFPHGATLCEIRSGSGHYTIVPKSLHFKANEYVEWERYEDIKNYPGDLDSDLRKVALSTALCILYASQGSRDEYCTAIAGILNKHTDWKEDEINTFIYNIAVESNDDEAESRSQKGSTSKSSGKTFGMPKLAQIWNCDIKIVAEIFNWIGVKNESVKGAGSIGDVIEYGQDRYIVKVTGIDFDEKEKKVDIIVDGPTLMKPSAFYDEVMRQAAVWVPKMKPVDFEKIMRKKFDLRTKSNDYVEESSEDLRFVKYFRAYVKRTKAFTDKKQLYVYKLPYYEHKDSSIYFNLDQFEDYLESQKINIKRVDLVLKIQRILKGKKINGKYKDNSCVYWKIEKPKIDEEDIMIEGEIILEEKEQITYES
jgi:hypothetical protein